MIETRETTLYVMADSIEDAKEDAGELSSNIQFQEWDTVDLDFHVWTAGSEPSPRQQVWSGGPDGHDFRWGDA